MDLVKESEESYNEDMSATTDQFAVEAYLDLTSWKHRKLFEGVLNVWEALKAIKPYLDSCELGEIACSVPNGVTIENRELVSIGEGSVIEPGAYIRGPLILGKNCEVRHGAYLRGNIIAGDRVVIGHASEVKHSILLDGAAAAHFAYVGDSILGNRVNLGAGTKLANLLFDRKEIEVRYEGKKITTGLRKIGAILGDDAQTGCNAVPNPGTLFKKGARCKPCSNPSGIICFP